MGEAKVTRRSFLKLGAGLLGTTLFSGCAGLLERAAGGGQAVFNEGRKIVGEIPLSPNAIMKRIQESKVPTPDVKVVEFANPSKPHSYVYLVQDIHKLDRNAFVYTDWEERQGGGFKRDLAVFTTIQGQDARLKFDAPSQYGDYNFLGGVVGQSNGFGNVLTNQDPGVLETEKLVRAGLTNLDKAVQPQPNKVEFIQAPDALYARLEGETKAGPLATCVRVGPRGSIDAVMKSKGETDMPAVMVRGLTLKELSGPPTEQVSKKIVNSIVNSPDLLEYYGFKYQNPQGKFVPERTRTRGFNQIQALWQAPASSGENRQVGRTFLLGTEVGRDRLSTLVSAAYAYTQTAVAAVQNNLAGRNDPRIRLSLDLTSPAGKEYLITGVEPLSQVPQRFRSPGSGVPTPKGP